MKKVFVLLVLSMVLLSFTSCDSPAHPSHPPVPVKKYTFKVQYIILPEWYINQMCGFAPGTMVETGFIVGGRIENTELQVINDYLFEGRVEVNCGTLYDIYEWDPRRQPEGTPIEDQISFPDIFIFENEQTGVKYQLTKFVKAQRDAGQFAEFQVLDDGSIPPDEATIID